MAKINTKVPGIKTHEGGTAKRISDEQTLRRSVMACMLWEKTFYEDGQDIATRIASVIPKVNPGTVSSIAIEARTKMNLRHAPLLVTREMARASAKHRELVGVTLENVIQRADELAEFLAIYWKDGKQPVSAQVKKGLARAFKKFNEYALAKYNRDGAVKLVDVLKVVHPTPDNAKQAELWGRLKAGNLATPDTWEVALSGGKDKRETWIRLITEGKLGGLAFLRNLRNMQDVGVPDQIIRDGIKAINTSRILPFRFIAAARYAPKFEAELEDRMLDSARQMPKLSGRTILLEGVSGSMKGKLSAKSDMSRMDAASGLAIILREICESVGIYTFSDSLKLVPSRRGFALRDAIDNSQRHNSTYLSRAIKELDTKEKYDRIIIITDEQSHDGMTVPRGRSYLINVASYRNGVGYGKTLHIDGFSESVVGYIQAYEAERFE